MAEGKKSFIAYSDWEGMFKALPDEVAGKLIKHIFSYVNDQNPITEDYVINALFEQIKSTLKRDLLKWQQQTEQRKNAGIKSAEIRKRNSTKFNERSISSTDSVSVSDSVNDIEKNKILNNSLLSEIKISDDKNFLLFKENQIETSKETIFYFKTAVSFQLLFIKNLKEKKSPTTQLELANFKNFVEPIRLMFEKDKITSIQIRQAYDFLNSKEGDFWKPNILSTKKLREKISVLLAKANTSVNPIKQNTFIPDPNKRKRIT
jgi:hypothetical protein